MLTFRSLSVRYSVMPVFMFAIFHWHALQYIYYRNRKVKRANDKFAIEEGITDYSEDKLEIMHTRDAGDQGPRGGREGGWGRRYGRHGIAHAASGSIGCTDRFFKFPVFFS